MSLTTIAAICALIFLIRMVGNLFCCLFRSEEEKKLSRKKLRNLKGHGSNSEVDKEGYRETDFSIISTRFAAKRSYIKDPPFAD